MNLSEQLNVNSRFEIVERQKRRTDFKRSVSRHVSKGGGGGLRGLKLRALEKNLGLSFFNSKV